MVNYGPASKFYDLFGSKNDISFYLELALNQERKRALELGVGTGRVAIELAKAGVAVHGVDNSKYMLALARRKLTLENPAVRRRVKLTYADMRELRVRQTCPFVYSASSTFEHCITEEEQRRCLISAHRALERGGTLAFDISQPRGKVTDSWWIDRRDVSKGEEVVRSIFSRTDPETSAVSVNLFYDVYRKGLLTQRFYECGKAKLSPRKDVEKLLEEVGFAVQEVYGDFDKTPHSKHSGLTIFVCTRR